MRKKYWLIALSNLLLVPVIYYLNIVNAQKKKFKYQKLNNPFFIKFEFIGYNR